MSSSDSDGLLDSNPYVGVGFSDSALLFASIGGFVVLSILVYYFIVLGLKTKEEEERDDVARGDLDYEDFLVHADVSTLSRAERRARARAIMRNERRLEGGGGGGGENNNNNNNDHHAASRKERQKAAKAAEKEERRLLEADRKKQQLAAQEAAQKEKRERERGEAERLEEEKKRRQAEKEAKDQEEHQKWLIFLSSSLKTQTVEEFIAVLEEDGVILIDDVAVAFGVSPSQVKDRINQLLEDGRILGVFEKDGRFIYFRGAEVEALISAIRKRSEISDSEVAELCNTVCVGGGVKQNE